MTQPDTLVTTGLYAVGWDDLNTSSPTSFQLWPYDANTTVTERTDLANPGVNGIGIVKVFDVQRAAGSTLASVLFDLGMSNATKAPRFDNLLIYGPGDFSYVNSTPTVLDNTDPYALSATWLDRLSPSLGSARWVDSTIDFAGIAPYAEPELLRELTDFTWNGVYKKTWSFAYSQARPFVPASSFIYSSEMGSPFPATLGHVDRRSHHNTDHHRRGHGPGDVRADPDDRLGKDASHGGQRHDGHSNSRSFGDNGDHPQRRDDRRSTTGSLSPRSVSLVPATGWSQSSCRRAAHGMKTGEVIFFKGNPWPDFTYTDGTVANYAGLDRTCFVTGANSFVIAMFASNSGTPVTLSAPVTLNPAVHQSWSSQPGGSGVSLRVHRQGDIPTPWLRHPRQRPKLCVGQHGRRDRQENPR